MSSSWQNYAPPFRTFLCFFSILVDPNFADLLVVHFSIGLHQHLNHLGSEGSQMRLVREKEWNRSILQSHNQNSALEYSPFFLKCCEI